MKKISWWCCILQIAAWSAFIAAARNSGLLDRSESYGGLLIYAAGAALMAVTVVISMIGIGTGAHHAIRTGGGSPAAWIPAACNAVLLLVQVLYSFLLMGMDFLWT